MPARRRGMLLLGELQALRRRWLVFTEAFRQQLALGKYTQWAAMGHNQDRRTVVLNTQPIDGPNQTIPLRRSSTRR